MEKQILAGVAAHWLAGSAVVVFLIVGEPLYAATEARSGTIEITVVDGDKLIVDGRVFDLEGIDAPELGQTCRNGEDEWKCGLEAASVLKKVIDLNPVVCEPTDADQSVLAGHCLINETTDLARIQVEAGYAVADPESGSTYQEAEATAKTARLGLWRGDFDSPWEWRRRYEISGPEVAAERCVVKGKITESGDRIYFVPSDPDYDDQIVDLERGERLFCSDDQARVEGWGRYPR